MPFKNTLTNEQLTQRFDNPFALVNYAIGLAKARMEKGEGSDPNPVSAVLESISSGHDLLDSIDEEDDEEEE